MKNKILYRTSPNWSGIIIAAIGIIAMSLLLVFNVEAPPYPKISFGELLFVLCVVIFHSLKICTITECDIAVKILGVTVRRISWKKVSAAVYIPHRYVGVPQGSVVVTRHPGKPYVPNRFVFVNPLWSIKFYIPSKDKQKCINILCSLVGNERVLEREHTL